VERDGGIEVERIAGGSSKERWVAMDVCGMSRLGEGGMMKGIQLQSQGDT
jgi:hypothetical protein